MKTNYPWQINSVIHKTKSATKTLGMDAMLFSPKKEDELRTPAAPLEMHEGYSRFKGTLIVKIGDTKVLTFNIPAKSVPYIHKKTSMVIDMALNSSVGNGEKATETEGSSPAYTVRFRAGTLSGKTPAELLIESPENKAVLEKQKGFLEKNLEKFPANKTQIDAIDDALKLLADGKLSPSSASAAKSGKPIIIYESAPKNIKQLDEEGRYLIYQVTITYDPAMSMPVEVSVMNCYAPVDKKKGNEIVLSKAVGKDTQNIRLTEEEWYTMIDSMKATKIMFETLTYPEQMKLAAELSRESFEASKKTV